MYLGVQPPNLRVVWNTMMSIRKTMNFYGGSENLYNYLNMFDIRNDGMIFYSDFVDVFCVHRKTIYGLSKFQVKDIADTFIYNGLVKYEEFLHSLPAEPGSDEEYYTIVSDPKQWLDFDFPNPVTRSERQCLEKVLCKISQTMLRLSVSPKSIFFSYEAVIRKGGVMSVGQFSTALVSNKIRLNADEFFLIVKRYIYRDYGINFIVLSHDVRDRMNFLLRTTNPYNNYFSDLHAQITHPESCEICTKIVGVKRILFHEQPFDVLRLMRNIMHCERVNIERVFAVADPLHKGRLSKTRFIDLMLNSGIKPISKKDIEVLSQLYQSPEDQFIIVYKHFLKDLSSVKHTVSCPYDFYHPTLHDLIEGTYDIRGDHFPHTTRIRKHTCKMALTKLRKYLSKRRYRLFEDFKIHDLRKCGHVAPWMFRRVLNNIRAINVLNATELWCIDERFVDPDGFDYVGFLVAVHEYIDVHNLMHNTIENPVTPSFEEVISKIRTQLGEQSTNLSYCIFLYNRHQKIWMHVDVLRRATLEAGLQLTNDDFTVIASVFGALHHRNMIDVKLLLEIVYYDQQYYDYFENMPIVVPLPLEGVPILEDGIASLTPSERCFLDGIMIQFASKAEFFDEQIFFDFDSHRNGVLDKNELLSALCFLAREISHFLSHDELDMIYKAFSRRHSYSRIEGVDYLALCKVVQDVHQLCYS